jgi:endonuclease/exonuclease/phosphatase family metal-dependent hydrolase
MALRLATYNLLHGMTVLGGRPGMPRAAEGRPLDGPEVGDDTALRRAVTALDADIIGLQEVDVHQPRSGFTHQVRSVADALHAEHWRFAPSVIGTPGVHGWRPADERIDHTGHPDDEGTGRPVSRPPGADVEVARMGPLYGVGLVSRLPVLEWRTTRFDAAPWSLPLLVPGGRGLRIVRVPDEPRAAIAAVVQGSTAPFTVATVHLSFVPGYNVRQLHELMRWLSAMPRPLVLLGDFNLPGALPKRLTGWTRLGRQATYPTMSPKVQLDHVLGDGLNSHQIATASPEVHLLPVSDHCAVTVDLDL